MGGFDEDYRGWTYWLYGRRRGKQVNYNEIVALALSYSDREDNEVISRIDNFISITEARINRMIKVRQMSNRSAVNTAEDQEYYGLPPDFAGMRDIEIIDTGSGKNRQTLPYLTPEQMNNLVRNSQFDSANVDISPESSLSQNRIYYTIIANQIQIYPPQVNMILEIVYYQNIPNLKANAPNNWLGDFAPDVYVFGILTEISAFVKDAEAGVLWNDRFADALKMIYSNDAIERWSGTPLQTRVS